MKRLLTTMALGILTAITLRPITLSADIIPPKPLSVQETIVKYARVYAVPEKQLLAVSFCESSYTPNIKGDHGAALGIFQYHKPTFYSFASQMGENLNYDSYTDQARLTAWVWANHPEYRSQWSCWAKVRNKV